MYCSKCGKPVSKDSFYCSWCGSELRLTDTDAIVERIKVLNEINSVHELEIAKCLATIWRNEDYKRYGSLEAFGKIRLGMEKSSLYKYKTVGMKFFDEYGEPVLHNAEQWGYGKLTVLSGLEIKEIIMLQEIGSIDPNMTMSDLRETVRNYKELMEEHNIKLK